ncbi:MAG: glutamate--tRNA ligase [Acidithiobacillus sp.]|nr:glutamate--tRNA ligase [Acidithiobacillus sp.]
MMIYSSRFAPSPTGRVHLGNVRTALFAFLVARQSGGRFVLRLEDTDLERSSPALADALLEDLHWLGLDWEEGPDRGGPFAPYRQMERLPLYEPYYQQLLATGQAYPCFCTTEDLHRERELQRANGQAPRYAGRCRGLPPALAQERLVRGEPASLRFAVPHQGTLRVPDLIWGERSYQLGDLGDFVIRRSDGSPAFFFANAIDDALMEINLVLRGEDHLTNTPRQILLLQALGLPIPSYGHLPLILGSDAQPLSKRNGAASIQELREQGYLPEALCNYLGHLGHHFPSEEWRDRSRLAQDFSLAHVGRAPARFDPEQLRHWQALGVQRLSLSELQDWLQASLSGLVPTDHLTKFLQAIRGNILFPRDAQEWATRCYQPLQLPPTVQQELLAEGTAFWAMARQAYEEHPEDFRSLTRQLALRSGRKGKALFHPLRLALTGLEQGPELAALWECLPPAMVKQRLSLDLNS